MRGLLSDTNGLRNLYEVERITFKEPSYSDPINVLTEVRDKVRAIPEVEAIPIEWIEQYGRENWYDFGTQHNAITEMLKAWRKKNGSD